MTIQIPEKFEIIEDDNRYGARGRLVDPETKESYLLSNRRWKEVNRAFSGAPGTIVNSLLRDSGSASPVTVLDIGAGESFRAANELAGKNKKFSDRLIVVGVDLAAAAEERGGAVKIRGDALNLPIRDDTVDVAYSRQSIVYVTEGRPALLKQSLAEVSRVLKPGGIFFLDMDAFPHYQPADPRLESIMPEGASLYAAPAGSLISPLVKLENVLSGRDYNFEYLALVNGAPGSALENVIADNHFRLLLTTAF